MPCAPRIDNLNRSSIWLSKRRLALAVFLLAALAQICSAAVSHAQDEVVPYWQYAASARLNHLVPLDLNNDNNDELLIVDETGRAALLTASGAQLWTYEAQEPITAVGVVQVERGNQAAKSIVLGAQNRLLLLSDSGTVVWQTGLTAVSPSPALLAGSSEPAPFAPALWAAVTLDRVAWGRTVAQAILAAIVEHREAVEADTKN